MRSRRDPLRGAGNLRLYTSINSNITLVKHDHRFVPVGVGRAWFEQGCSHIKYGIYLFFCCFINYSKIATSGFCLYINLVYYLLSYVFSSTTVVFFVMYKIGDLMTISTNIILITLSVFAVFTDVF